MPSAVAHVSGAASAPRKYSRRDRAQYLTLLLLSSATLITARLLPPSPRGVGTHERLGLPPCLFLKLTGLPCPSCGLTTSFAHAAKLHFYDALRTQPFGLLAFCLTMFFIPLSLYLMHTRTPWARVIQARGARAVIYALLALFLLGWVYKIIAMS